MTFFMWVLQIQTQTLLLVQWTFLLTEPSSHPPFWSYIGFVLAPGFASKQPWTSAPIVWLLACKMQCLSHPVLQLSPHSARLEYLLHVWWTTHCVSKQSPTASSPCQQNILRLLRCKILLVCAWKTQPRFNPIESKLQTKGYMSQIITPRTSKLWAEANEQDPQHPRSSLPRNAVLGNQRLWLNGENGQAFSDPNASISLGQNKLNSRKQKPTNKQKDKLWERKSLFILPLTCCFLKCGKAL